MREKNLAVVILAAGKGTRMKSDLPKVLHKVAGKPMIEYVVETAKKLNANPIILIVGYQADKVKTNFQKSDIEFVLQEPQLGTGHAVLQAEQNLAGFDGDVLVLYGDVPFTKLETLQNLITRHRTTSASATILTTIMPDPTRYGRIIRTPKGHVNEIVEHSDINPEQAKIKEINTGIVCFDKEKLFDALKKVKVNEKKGEIYLTDTIKIMRDNDLLVEAEIAQDPLEVMGLDTQEKLKLAEEGLGKFYD